MCIFFFLISEVGAMDSSRHRKLLLLHFMLTLDAAHKDTGFEHKCVIAAAHDRRVLCAGAAIAKYHLPSGF